MHKTSSPDFDFTSCEMIFVYINKLRMFENQLVPLHPEYDVELFEKSFRISKSPDIIPDHHKTKLNIVAICGKNGVGKSTFLEMLRGIHSFEAEYIICWRDINENFASNSLDYLYLNEKKIILNEKKHNYKLSALCGFSNLGDENTMSRGLVSSYHREPELFNIHGTDLFDGFELRIAGDYGHYFDFAQSVSEHTGIEIDSSEFKTITDKHPTFLILANIARDSTFEQIAEIIKLPKAVRNLKSIYTLLSNKKSKELDEQINNLIFIDGDPTFTLENYEGIRHRADGPHYCKYEIKQYPEIFSKVQKLSKKVDQWLKTTLRVVKQSIWKTHHINLHIWEGRLHDSINFSPYQIRGSKNVHYNQLSSGEYESIKTLFEVAPMVDSDFSNWYPFDDCDGRLHPEWSRKYVDNLKNTHSKFCEHLAKLRDNANYVKNVMTCLLVTHSPFILSDLNKNAVLRFTKEKDEEGNDIPNGLTFISRASDSPFAGIIGELLHDDFFMKSTIGEHAKKILKDTIESLDNFPEDEKTLKRAENIFKQVGDKVLRRLLLERVKYAKD